MRHNHYNSWSGLKLLCLLAVAGMPCQVFAGNPHNLATKPVCDNCHLNTPATVPDGNTRNVRVRAGSFKQDGIHMCIGCHAEEEGHQVGISLDFSVPADLPLDKNNTITCLTCHYTHGSLNSDRPQASYSFMDVLLGSERLHKSFLIRRGNVNGELCLACHNSSK